MVAPHNTESLQVSKERHLFLWNLNVRAKESPGNPNFKGGGLQLLHQSPHLSFEAGICISNSCVSNEWNIEMNNSTEQELINVQWFIPLKTYWKNPSNETTCVYCSKLEHLRSSYLNFTKYLLKVCFPASKSFAGSIQIGVILTL